jgi:serine/threonine protein kinase
MEYIDGQSLVERLDRKGKLSEREALSVTLQILEALIHLHSQEHPIIHRDIKPDNLKVDREGNAWLLDLGIGKSLDQRTMHAALAATEAYAPLEQLQYQPTDQRSDLFALGATLYHLVAGQFPPTAIERQLGATITAASIRRAGVSDRCTAIIERAMQLEPAARYQSAGDMHKAVEALLDPNMLRRAASAGQLRDKLSAGQPQSIKATFVLPPQQAVMRTVAPALPPSLDRAVRTILGQASVLKLYSHQAESLERARKGNNLVIVTGTASGKSLCFTLPILERCILDQRAHALYLYPIKALINDQAEKLVNVSTSVARFGGPTHSIVDPEICTTKRPRFGRIGL